MKTDSATSTRVRARMPFVRALLMALFCAFGFGAASSQTYPNGPITLLLYAPPGGILDVVARAFAQKMTPTLGQTIVIDYKPGGNGAIAAEALLRAAPDGQTLLFDAVFNHTVLPKIQKLRYDAIRDFQPITTATRAAPSSARWMPCAVIHASAPSICA